MSSRQRDYPWWQRRLSTARRSMAYAIFYSVMGVVWVAAFLPFRLGEDSEAWFVVLGVAVAVGWVLLAAAHVSGAIAQRHEEAAAHQL